MEAEVEQLEGKLQDEVNDMKQDTQQDINRLERSLEDRISDLENKFDRESSTHMTRDQIHSLLDQLRNE